MFHNIYSIKLLKKQKDGCKMTKRELILANLSNGMLEELKKLRMLTLFIKKTIEISNQYIEPDRLILEMCKMDDVRQFARALTNQELINFPKAYKKYEDEKILKEGMENLPKSLENVLIRYNAYKKFEKEIRKKICNGNRSIFKKIKDEKKPSMAIYTATIAKDTIYSRVYWWRLIEKTSNLEEKYPLSWE